MNFPHAADCWVGPAIAKNRLRVDDGDYIGRQRQIEDWRVKRDQAVIPRAMQRYVGNAVFRKNTWGDTAALQKSLKTLREAGTTQKIQR